MSKMGRPRKELDWNLLESLAALDADLNYCAERQCVGWKESPDFKLIKAAREVIERRIKERYHQTFTEYKKQKMEPIRLKLRQKQISVALDGNPTLLIWLGKNMLGQSDNVVIDNGITGISFSSIRRNET